MNERNNSHVQLLEQPSSFVFAIVPQKWFVRCYFQVVTAVPLALLEIELKYVDLYRGDKYNMHGLFM